MNELWNWLLVLHFVAALPAVAHALLKKRNPRSALGWILVVLTYPVIGSLIYAVFAINRINPRLQQAQALAAAMLSSDRDDTAEERDRIRECCGEHGVRSALLEIGQRVSSYPLRDDNSVELLVDGDGAYPAMLAAIDNARHRVWMSTYIFDSDRTGQRFIDALAAATARGVDVRVLVDSIGLLLARSRAVSRLRRAGVNARRFLPPRLIPPEWSINLRNHRKILCVDSGVAFAGGMNIGGRHMVAEPETDRPVADTHFRFEGTLATDLSACFLRTGILPREAPNIGFPRWIRSTPGPAVAVRYAVLFPTVPV